MARDAKVVIPMGTDTKILFKINYEYKHAYTTDTTFLISDSCSQTLVTLGEMKTIILELQKLIEV